MSAGRVVGAVAAFGLVSAGATGLAVAGSVSPAQAFAGTCPITVPAATLVADNVCEVRITTSGAFTPPTGITKLAGVLVAGGGGSMDDGANPYAGSGGKIVYIDSLALGAPLTVVIGAGGLAGTSTGTGPTHGGDTTVTGALPAAGGYSGNDGGAFCDLGGLPVVYGDGAQTNASCAPSVGIGYKLSELGADPALFPASADGTEVFGNGGNATVAGAVASSVAGSGAPADSTHDFDGTAGLVILRFAPAAPVTPVTPAAPAPALVATGSAVPWSVPAGSLTLIVAGAMLLALRRRHTAR